MNPLHASLCMNVDAIIKTRAFVQVRTHRDSCKKTEQWYQYLRDDTQMPPHDALN